MCGLQKMGDYATCDYSCGEGKLATQSNIGETTLWEWVCGLHTHRVNGYLNSKNRMMCKEMNKVTSIASSLVPTTYVASKD